MGNRKRWDVGRALSTTIYGTVPVFTLCSSYLERGATVLVQEMHLVDEEKSGVIHQGACRVARLLV